VNDILAVRIRECKEFSIVILENGTVLVSLPDG